jgi:hypothetical protein
MYSTVRNNFSKEQFSAENNSSLSRHIFRGSVHVAGYTCCPPPTIDKGLLISGRACISVCVLHAIVGPLTDRYAIGRYDQGVNCLLFFVVIMLELTLTVSKSDRTLIRQYVQYCSYLLRMYLQTEVMLPMSYQIEDLCGALRSAVGCSSRDKALGRKTSLKVRVITRLGLACFQVAAASRRFGCRRVAFWYG